MNQAMLGLYYAHLDRSGDALDVLEETVKKEDYYRQIIALDPDLAVLKSDPRFKY